MASSNSETAGDAYHRQWEALAGWFLGPRAENRDVFNTLMLKCLNWHENRREDFFPSDPCYFTNEIKDSVAAKAEFKDLEEKMAVLHAELNKSIPFFSTRYQGHMTWDTTMPAILGYVSGLLWNQNNVDSTASPVTTQFEVRVGNQLCELMRFPADPVPWGHLTGCGSVANIESMWAARNTKLHPLALRAACQDKDYPLLKVGLNYKVYVPGRLAHLQSPHHKFGDCTTWELLNLRIDDICNLTDNIVDHIAKHTPAAGKSEEEHKAEIKSKVDAALEKHSCVQIGLPSFYKAHGIGNPIENSTVETYPCVCSPGTNHYSWPKSATILGIGDQHVIPITVDEKARQDIAALRKELDRAVKYRIPIFMVVAVIGSTEESAVDNIQEIINLKPDYERQGLTFSVHADAAWGGYLNTMTHEGSSSNVTTNNLGTDAHDYIPTIPLSDFVKEQYLALKFADTVTIDPHKAGFCPYPAGALLYRNGTMKGFITLAAPEVFHNPNDLNVGVYGLEGSKPGAAACSVLLSHQVIGLDTNGYGRILGQCQLGSKLFYCMWETTAKKHDPFILMNFIPPNLDEINQSAKLNFQTLDELHTFIEDYILGEKNEVLVKNKHGEMDLLKIVGPDALINQFTINCFDPNTQAPQTNIELTNDLQDLVFNELTSSVGENTKRVKLFLTTSKLALKNYGKALQQLKKRLNLPLDGKDLGFLRNTCMEPYQASEEYVVQIGNLFRNTVLSCIGALDPDYGTAYGDPVDYHTFTVVNSMRSDGKVFLDFVPSFKLKQSKYQTVFRVVIAEQYQSKFKEYQAAAGENALSLKTTEKYQLFNFVKTDIGNAREMKVMQNGAVLGIISVTIDEVWEYRHFELPEYAEYNTHQKYFLYGDAQEAFLSHIITKSDDFYQVVRLEGLPQDVPPELIDLGLTVELTELKGSPLVVGGKIINPLQQKSYSGSYKGRQFADCFTSLNIGKTVVFDYGNLNP